MAETELLQMACNTSKYASYRPATRDNSSPSKVCSWARHGHSHVRLALELMPFDINQGGPPINRYKSATLDKFWQISRCQWKHLVETTNKIETKAALLYDLLDLLLAGYNLSSTSLCTKSSGSVLISHSFSHLLPFLHCQ